MAEKLLPKIDQFQFEKLSFGDFMSKCTSEVDIQINTQMNLDIFSSQRGLGKFTPTQYPRFSDREAPRFYETFDSTRGTRI